MTARMRVLLRLLSTPVGGFHAQLWSYFAAGSAMFNAKQAIFYHRTLGRCLRYSLNQGFGPEALVVTEEVFGAQHQALLCLNEPQVLDDISESYDKALLLAYTQAQAGRYLLAPLPHTSAALVFVVDRHEDSGVSQLSPEDKETLALLAEGVARMVHLHASPEKILRTQEGFAVSGIHTECVIAKTNSSSFECKNGIFDIGKNRAELPHGIAFDQPSIAWIEHSMPARPFRRRPNPR